jgi:hypothetical protein
LDNKYPPSTAQSAAGKLATLNKIANENSQCTDETETHEWLPECN